MEARQFLHFCKVKDLGLKDAIFKAKHLRIIRGLLHCLESRWQRSSFFIVRALPKECQLWSVKPLVEGWSVRASSFRKQWDSFSGIRNNILIQVSSPSNIIWCSLIFIDRLQWHWWLLGFFLLWWLRRTWRPITFANNNFVSLSSNFLRHISLWL